MFPGILSILFLIFKIPTSFCLGEDTMGEGTSSFEVAIFQQEIFQYNVDMCPHESCNNIVDQYSEKCRLLWTRRLYTTRILSCTWLGEITACRLPDNEHYYKWIDSSAMGRYGHGYPSCPHPGEVISATTRYTKQTQRLLFTAGSCHCDLIRHSWKIYLGTLQSRERDNYVIAGIRFKVQNQVLFLQPAEGKLGANGQISNRSWVPLPEDTHKSRVITMHARTFFLSNLTLNSGYAMTGIEIDQVDRGAKYDISGFAMSISGVPFDSTTWKLDLTPGRRKVVRDSPSTTWRQLKYPLKNPIHSKAANNFYRSPQRYNYVQLERSERSDDFGQSTLPLFDSTPISYRYLPLAGIEIFHKGSEHHAGYIALQIYPVV